MASYLLSWLFGRGAQEDEEISINDYLPKDPKERLLFRQAVANGPYYPGPTREYGKPGDVRCGFGVKLGATVTGWPAEGGHLRLHCSIVELKFLGLNTFEPAVKSDDPDEEAAHCARMRQLGAKWYPDGYQEMLESQEREKSDSPRLFAG